MLPPFGFGVADDVGDYVIHVTPFRYAPSVPLMFRVRSCRQYSWLLTCLSKLTTASTSVHRHSSSHLETHAGINGWIVIPLCYSGSMITLTKDGMVRIITAGIIAMSS